MIINIESDTNSIDKWIDQNIEENGAQDFFDVLNDSSNCFFKDNIYEIIKNIVKNRIKPTKINTIHDLAKLLNGNEYGDEFENDIIEDINDFCAERNWLVVVPYSDDNIELRGACDDEISAGNETMIRFVKAGDFYMDEFDDKSYHKATENKFVPINETEFDEIKKETYDFLNYDGLIIDALWEPERLPDYAWAYKVLGNVDYAEFDIFDDGEPWARCMIIDLNNINN